MEHGDRPQEVTVDGKIRSHALGSSYGQTIVSDRFHSECADNHNVGTMLTDPPTVVNQHHVVAPANGTAAFDLACIRDQFAAALNPSTGQVLLEPYIAGYREVLRFVQALGTLFNFVGQDLNEKLCVLEDRRAGPNAKHYQTVEDMMVFEISQGVKTWKKRESGSRVLLVLHRALQFLSGFIEGVPNVPDGGKLSNLASEVYDRTLAHHHAYLVRKAVGVAVHTLPTKDQLAKLACGGKYRKDEVVEILKQVPLKIVPVRDRTEQLFIQYDLKNLTWS